MLKVDKSYSEIKKTEIKQGVVIYSNPQLINTLLQLWKKMTFLLQLSKF